ncbi:MAG: hypothetical protein Q4Q53_07775 [Methanocorpusculum sp.]|nr:hypothetical protein [Methanocorpusculum sp.]
MRKSLEAVILKNAKADWLNSPIVCVADVNSPLIRNIRTHTFENHLMPEDILPTARVVISYFLPFRKEYALTNSEGIDPSEIWVRLYVDTNKIIEEVNLALVSKINELGYSADFFKGGFDENKIMSRWSQKHIAEAAGLGKFGVNNLLITKVGSCGRFGSVVSDIPVECDLPMTDELCLYKSKGKCGVCIKRCSVKALSLEGYNRKVCYERCLSNEIKYGADVCGKCAVNIPCAFFGVK